MVIRPQIHKFQGVGKIMRRSYKRCLVLSVAAMSVTHLTVPSSASDYAHSCASAGSYFGLVDGELRAGNGNAIPYKVLKRRVLRNRQGFCISKRSPKQPFPFEMRSYVMLLKFRYQNQDMVMDFVCEVASDGLPAALNCDREQVTVDSENY